jgi:hypothetical protein
MIKEVCGVLYYLCTVKIVKLFTLGTIQPTLNDKNISSNTKKFFINLSELVFIILCLYLLKRTGVFKNKK